jgi:uncharacterized protein (DUF58 family)
VLLNFEGEAEGVKTDEVHQGDHEAPARDREVAGTSDGGFSTSSSARARCRASRRCLAVHRAKVDEDLFDDEFQRKLDYLAMVSKRVFSGAMRAERRTKKVGSGVEFADHRDYAPGDDFALPRLARVPAVRSLLVRLYEEEEDL